MGIPINWESSDRRLVRSSDRQGWREMENQRGRSRLCPQAPASKTSFAERRENMVDLQRIFIEGRLR
jgi:hypothetical protein